MGLVIICAAARPRLAWWPLHPVIFLVWGTTPLARFGFSFLLGWSIKAAVVRVAGARGYKAAVPIVCGLIAGELVAALALMIVGAAYYARTGLMPAHYWIFPA